MKKLGHFAFEGVADELKGPANQEKDQRHVTSAWIKIDATNRARLTTMMGMPKVWQARFIGCWWLVAYCETHRWLLFPPHMFPEWYTGMAHPGALSCSASGN